MASVKIKFRPSVIEGKEGVLYYQVISNRVVRRIHTEFKILPSEWNGCKESVLICQNGERRDYLLAIEERIQWELELLRQIILRNRNFSADDIVKEFLAQKGKQSFFNLMNDTISRLKLLGKIRTSENYTSTFNSFRTFCNGKDIMLSAIDSELMEHYEAYLISRGITANTVSFYMRILRATYNRAVERGIVVQQYPFRRVYTGIAKTVKRALSLQAIKRIKTVDLSAHPSLAFARDVFMFSFYMRGMSFIDIAYLRKSDLKNGILTYNRRKTGQRLSIRWEKCMQEIVDRYDKGNCSPYLLPIFKTPCNSLSQYKNMLYLINKNLKEVAHKAGMSASITLYVARHSWASIAKSKNIPVSVISEGLGHDSEMTTQIYLASLDNAVVDRANAQILKEL